MKKIKMIIKNNIKIACALVISFLFSLVLFTTNVYAINTTELFNGETLDITNYYHNNRVNPYSSTNYDDEYGFTPGASLVKDDFTELVFELKINDYYNADYSKYDIWYYEFTIYCNDFKTPYAYIQLAYDNDFNGAYTVEVSKKDFEFSILSASPIYNEYTNSKAYKLIDDFSTNKDIYTFQSWGLFTQRMNNKNDSIYFYIQTKSPYSSSYDGYDYINDKYSVVFDYVQYTKDYEVVDYGNLASSYVSVFDVLTSRKDLDVLNKEINKNNIDEINGFYESISKEVIVEYLERVGETPFAVWKKKIIEVPIYDNELLSMDVAKALNVKSMGVMQSYASNFEYNQATGTYRPKYAKSIWLSAKSVDGNSCNYFLDCNNSFKDYYYQFVERRIFSIDLYEYMLNSIYMKYPELQQYSDNEIYGYFGLVSIPNTYSINELWTQMFGNETTFDGVLEKFVFTEQLSYESYNALLNDFNYNWLEIAWNTVSGFVSGMSYSADTYIFYADCETNQAFIGENGASDIEDNDSAIKNDIDNVVNELGELFNFESFDDLFNLVIGVIGLYLIGNMIVKIAVVLFSKKRR